MAQIPDYTALGATPIPTPAYRRPFLDDSAARVDEAIAGFGGTLTKVADDVQQKARADAATWASNKLTDFRVQTMQAMQEAQANAPDDAHGFTPAVLADFDKRAGELTGVAQDNPLAGQSLEKAVPQLRAQVAENAMRWEAQQRVTYRAQSVLDNTTKLAPLVQADPSQRLTVGAQLLTQIDAAGLEPDKRTALKNHVISELAVAGARGAAQADPAGTLAQLNDPNDQTYTGLSLPQREGLQQFARGQIVDQQSTALAQVFKDQGARAGDRALQALDNNASLAPDVRDDIRGKTNGLLSQLRQDQRNQHVQQIAQLDETIANGQAGAPERATAWALYDANAFDPDQLVSSLTSIDRSQKKAASDAALLAYGMKNFISSTPMDPKASEDKNAVNAVFNAIIAKAPPSPGTALGAALGAAVPGTPGSDGYANTAVAVTQHTGIVPPDVISWGRANLVSADPKSAAAAANLLSRLDETNPSSFGYAVDDAKTRAMISTIANAVKAGTDPAAAVALARHNASLPQPQLEALKEQWRTSKAQGSQSSALSSILSSDPAFKPGWFTGVPQTPPLMAGQFDQLTRSYYNETGGNLSQARQLAAQDLKRSWGVSEVNGARELMQYAPEAMFPGLSAAVVRDDVARTVQDNAAAFDNVDPSKVRLTATDRTARTGGQDWALSVPDKFGAYDVVRGQDGNPLTYRLPVSQSDYSAARARQAQTDIEKARQLRENLAEAEPAGP